MVEESLPVGSTWAVLCLLNIFSSMVLCVSQHRVELVRNGLVFETMKRVQCFVLLVFVFNVLYCYAMVWEHTVVHNI